VIVEPALELTDIQGNVLRGYRSANARHFALSVEDPAGARRFIAGLISGNEARSPQITNAEEWNDKPHYTLNIGITWAGLKALGLPSPVLGDFPPAFQQGPATRATEPDPDFPGGVGLGDVGKSAPRQWVLGGERTPEVHMMLSLYTDEHRKRRINAVSARLRKGFAAGRLTEISAHDANALPQGKVHFGYRDGIAQPEIRGAPGRPRRDKQPTVEPGDFLLGRDYVNLYGGNFLGDLPPALGDNACYAAFRMLRQDVLGFERFLNRWAKQFKLDPELVAAKLMGRWRNGVPLTLSPDVAEPDPPLAGAALNDFDYAPAPGHNTFYDDFDGRRCPVGAHIRRLNPRSSLVMGQPHSRRLIRRGMPYGPAFDPDAGEDHVERGLIGLFLCGDLELQFEFILRVWANQDLSTHGLRGTREPILGAQPAGGGKFVLRTADSRDPIVMLGLPRLVQTVGSVYCLVPGIGGLRYLASLGGAPEVSQGGG
jgi:deferrochelatase/peroxidase EfeB